MANAAPRERRELQRRETPAVPAGRGSGREETATGSRGGSRGSGEHPLFVPSEGGEQGEEVGGVVPRDQGRGQIGRPT